MSKRFTLRAVSSHRSSYLGHYDPHSEATTHREEFRSTTPVLAIHGISKGLLGYQVPKVGPAYRHPQYSIPKEKQKDFLSEEQRRAKKIPGPHEHVKFLSWKNNMWSLKGSSRNTIIDKIFKEKKLLPAPNSYRPSTRDHVPLGKYK